MTRRRSRTRYGLAALLPGLCLAGCGGLGPPTVTRDRTDYGSSIGNSWKEQTLLNIVKLRYADMPVFLEVAQVIAGYQLQTALGTGFSAGNVTAGLVGPFTASGTLSASGTYTDRPTVVYAPLTGVDFLKRLMTPIPPSSVLFVLQSGYAAARVMPIMLDSVNGLDNGSNRRQRAPDPGFDRLVQLVGEGQRVGSIEMRVEPRKAGAESSVILFPPRDEPAAAERRREIARLLRVRPGLRELTVFYGAYSGKDDEIDMKTRSMLEIMLEFAAAVQVPAEDVASGRASPGAVAAAPQRPWSGPAMRVVTGDATPGDAHVAVQYGKKWYWIADTDIESKTTFGIVMLLFSIADTGTRGAAPVVTIPANQ
jgi:hypothetical protein